ncbi:ParA family protein, partial [Escherichia coli]|uniref:ParA family protein n=6 Tax=Bacteria TaxID=2 RepID=UPI003CED8175
EIKENYDFIIIDVPPQLNKFTNSALVASDYVIVILQTQERSLKGAEKYIEHLIQLNNDYGTEIDILGLLPVLVQNGNDLDLD